MHQYSFFNPQHSKPEPAQSIDALADNLSSYLPASQINQVRRAYMMHVDRHTFLRYCPCTTGVIEVDVGQQDGAQIGDAQIMRRETTSQEDHRDSVRPEMWVVYFQWGNIFFLYGPAEISETAFPDFGLTNFKSYVCPVIAHFFKFKKFS